MIGTPDLRERYGMRDSAIHDLVRRGILRPRGAGGSGSRWAWDEAEQRAFGAVATLMRSHLMAGLSKSPHGSTVRERALREIAEATRAPLPDYASARWLIVLGDGSCLRGDDWLAAAISEPRTLVEITRPET